jgi:hypothetical protein
MTRAQERTKNYTEALPTHSANSLTIITNRAAVETRAHAPQATLLTLGVTDVTMEGSLVSCPRSCSEGAHRALRGRWSTPGQKLERDDQELHHVGIMPPPRSAGTLAAEGGWARGSGPVSKIKLPVVALSVNCPADTTPRM